MNKNYIFIVAAISGCSLFVPPPPGRAADGGDAPIVLHRVASDGERFSVAIFGDKDSTHFADWLATVHILTRAEFETLAAGVQDQRERFSMPGLARPVDVFHFELHPERDGVVVSDYAIFINTLVVLPADKTGSYEGASAAQGFAIANCRASFVATSSPPFFHLLQLRDRSGIGRVRLSSGTESAIHHSSIPTPHSAYFANAFYNQELFVDVSFACVP